MKNLRKTLDKIGEKAAAAKHKQFLKDLSGSGWEDTTYRNDQNISIGYGEPDYDKYKFWFVPITNDESNSAEFDNHLNSKMIKDAFPDADDFYFGKNNVFDKDMITAEDFDEIIQNLEELNDEYTATKKLDTVIDKLQKMASWSVKALMVDENGEEADANDLSEMSGKSLVRFVNDIVGVEESVKSDFARWM